ncbi:MAG TPA: hypothetical protein VF665_22810 [Longimicrobium sp.]|uniref:hypothetical protein n=1 Tax=Longimicrobium sp. TaxID=2029185 RepID=UPI002EDB07DB
MTLVIILLALAAASASAWGLSHYLGRLPVAPQCPCCRTVTDRRRTAGSVDLLLARLGGAAARECRRCGWAGRMRWRVATQSAGR